MRLVLWGAMGAMVASLGVLVIILVGKGTIPNPFGEQGLVIGIHGDAVLSSREEIIEACASWDGNPNNTSRYVLTTHPETINCSNFPDIVQHYWTPTASPDEAMSQEQDSSNAIDATPSPTQTHPATPTPTATPTPIALEGIVIAQLLNIRAGPDTDYEIVDKLPNGEVVKIIGRNQDGDWLNIDLGQRTAWVYSQLIETETSIDLLPVLDP